MSAKGECARDVGLRRGGGGGVCGGGGGGDGGLRLMTLFNSGTRTFRSRFVTAVMRGSLR